MCPKTDDGVIIVNRRTDRIDGQKQTKRHTHAEKLRKQVEKTLPFHLKLLIFVVLITETNNSQT